MIDNEWLNHGSKICCIYLKYRYESKWGNLGGGGRVLGRGGWKLKNDTNNFDLFYFNLKSEHLTTTKLISSQENLGNNIFLTYFNSCTGIKCHSCNHNMKPYFLRNPISWYLSFSLPKELMSRSPSLQTCFV